MSPPDGPSHEMVVPTASVNMPNKRKRGRNLCTKFKKLRENGLVPITIPPGAKGPVGENAGVFTRRVGFIVREHANLSYESWSKAPQEHRQMLKNRLVADFTLDSNRVEDKMCMEISLSSCYNNVRSNYYKEYLPFSKEEVRANVPPDLTQDKWDALCDLYETTSWKSDRNKENRGKNKTGHTCGSKSFIAYYEEKKQGGKEIGKVDFYKMTRTKKDGSFVTTTSEENYNLMIEKVADEENQSTEEEIFTEVLGTRRGFVRGMGKFVIPTPTPSSHLRYETSMNMELETCKQDLSNTMLKLSDAEQKQGESDQKLAETQNQVAQLQSQVEEQRQQLAILMARFGS
ncbi:uncharacterized protein LOC115971041 isoform X2 [Quercus lobata]|uniref:uncharacterized protein LOC115971041 isoform X2 n=1 Tax=Quercus lobata TaxID=97700 RepID=UPI0012468392|nr:uncharacterized protein LOC115971041 isoform X2 [Quercus lobata]